jgi:hypothetical protein
MPAGNYAGNFGQFHKIVDVTFSTDTSAYANADLIADTQAIDGVFRTTDGTGVINSIVIIDTDDQTLYTFSVVILDVSTTLGTENSAPAAADAACLGILARVDFATTDGLDYGGSKVYTKNGLNIPVKAISGTDDLGIAIINITGTPTHTAAGIRGRLGMTLD